MKALRILLVEDNPGDIELILEAFKECQITHDIDVVTDGQEAIDFLRRKEEYAQCKRPNLILLDLNLPKKDGKQVLQEIKNDPHLKRIPVIVLTSSAREEDVVKVYENYANCYVRKPVDLNDFLSLVRKVEDFWFTVVELPPVS
jgi:CheY-like chemotaxis protein